MMFSNQGDARKSPEELLKIRVFVPCPYRLWFHVEVVEFETSVFE